MIRCEVESNTRISTLFSYWGKEYDSTKSDDDDLEWVPRMPNHYQRNKRIGTAQDLVAMNLEYLIDELDMYGPSNDTLCGRLLTVARKPDLSPCGTNSCFPKLKLWWRLSKLPHTFLNTWESLGHIFIWPWINLHLFLNHMNLMLKTQLWKPLIYTLSYHLIMVIAWEAQLWLLKNP